LSRALVLAFALALGCRGGAEPTPNSTAVEEPTPEPMEEETPVQSPVEAPTPAAETAPLEVPHRINGEYEGKSAAHWQKNFEREGREVFARKDAIVKALALTPGMAVADVGAGSGLFTLAIAKAVGPKGRVYAVDVQDYFLESIAKRAKKAKLTNVETVHADQHASGLAEASIDLAVLVDSYHHLERPTAYLLDLHRALRPGARLVVIDFDRTRPDAGTWMKDHVRADPADFQREIEAAGFELLDRPTLLEENFVFVFRR
jgi:predicted methyltransferase